MVAKCQKCGSRIETYSRMRKWCADCRKRIAVLQAKARKLNVPLSELL